MCGVIGYVGQGTDVELLFNSLKKLEYRGYDSAGIAAIHEEKLYLEKVEGKLDYLIPKLMNFPKGLKIGIGHTRWATHGKPTIENAHPHKSGDIVLLHNGIIENYLSLKEQLKKLGYEFLSQTDTEVAAHLLHYEYTISNNPDHLLKMKDAFFKMVKKIKGAFAFVAMSLDTPECLFVAKQGSPLVIAKGYHSHYVASGMTAVIEHSKNVIVLEDGDIGYVNKDSFHIFDAKENPVSRQIISLDWDISMIEKDGYEHFMLKEINEHPFAVTQTLSQLFCKKNNDFEYDKIGIQDQDFSKIKRIVIIACGTSFIAGVLAKYYLEQWLKIPMHIELASEFRYRNPYFSNTDFVIAVSQSGETADTIQALKLVTVPNGPCSLSIVNVPGSSLSFISQRTLLMAAGPEIGVASTKSFSSQFLSLITLGLAISKKNNILNTPLIEELISQLFSTPTIMESALSKSKEIFETSKHLIDKKSLLFLGRGPSWPLALEGALKIKELSYIHAEAYPGGELKHGPIALIDESILCVVIAPNDEYKSKIISNIQEIKARGGPTLIIGDENDTELKDLADKFIGIPTCSQLSQPFVITVILHLLAYWLAVHKGTDVDQPRNLAKSVTVE